MDETEIKEFYRALSALAEMFNRTLSTNAQELYLAALGDMGLENFQAACKRSARESTHFPRPVELRGFVQGTPAEQSEMAWHSLMRMFEEGAGQYYSAFVEDGALSAAITRCWGGLIEAHSALRELAPDDPMYASQRNAFLRSYASAMSTLADTQPGRYFAGTCEIQNRGGIAREGQYRQPVVICGRKGVARLSMPFEGRTGELLPEAKQALLAKDKQALRPYVPVKPNLLQSAPECYQPVAAPDEVREYLEATPERRQYTKHLRLVESQEQEDAAANAANCTLAFFVKALRREPSPKSQCKAGVR